ncbi:sigma-70 family RNA polymerase sigma factor [Lysinibacillus mangiferihumi]|uniref:Sigma-70 family RNA polymerase sigma factor n=1 Tax=Lysinibacillus mangiferihumi TaxID=1130819 RepID=A0A4U2ZD17_9BACI|nr:sigma factor-like helix-turn-helix DNA-binding protein [Lysinibacillus mangiferihumi]TKI71642.1 sigma-70 family RNA polymerase sigma factor [Lysinibacillus mangiferihumi]
MIQNRLLKNFLNDAEIKELYQSYLEKPTTCKKEMIEKMFQIHGRKIQLLSYFSKTLTFESQKFDKKIRHNNKWNQLILDQNIDERGGKFLDLVADEQCYYDVEFNTPVESSELEMIFEDKQLYDIVSTLTEKQKKILYLLFVKNWTEEELAIELGVSKQAINKVKNYTLRKIKKEYESANRRNLNTN